ncbi:23S rRNA (uracil(1939)-C(5))-methyltransferase RlmD [Parafilimonas terrae]|uniref:23S rRNA m(5)U-1939 methyltransferase n=1 Tax=Parafilimonas terrae TaxID=1465490 RepID=A0A1I5Y2K7_9BACT|nr:23S rRNA (uracil(1939)-C(5))-methyltransferase RlmD [Parafilimonas terrae]SFQ38482.1 23S rRNA m(5)U-1939 methyltransferase [Parafilimonas terrae]
MRKRRQKVILEDILIENYAAEGKSIARIDGKVVFVENVVPGDIVDVQLYKSKKDWAEGFPLRIKKLSDNRVTPFCEHFGVCGGCQWQMLPYEKQLEYKQQQVFDVLKRIGKVELPETQNIVGATETKFYRNKLEYSFSAKKFIPENEFRQMLHEGKDTESVTNTNVAGFYAKGVFDKVVDIHKCWLQAEPTNALRNGIAAFAREHNFSFYDFKQHAGWLRNMMVRIATTGEIMLNIVLAYEHETNMQLLFDFIQQQFPQVTTLLYTINGKRNDSIYDLTPQVVYGKGYIVEKLEDYQFKISPKSFFQTNTKQGEKLYTIARNFAELSGKEVVYDLYCGTGSIGIFVSGLAKKIIGVEVISEAINDAKENAALNNIANTSFYTGDVIDICTDDFFEKEGKPDVIIVDPPRAGLHNKLSEKLLQIEAPLIVYVSCNPATQARDLQMLGEKYAVEKIQPVDMFPHTHHIENVIQLKLKN